MKKFIIFAIFFFIFTMMVSISSCKKSGIKSEIKSEKQIEIEAILCKTENYWFLYELDDSVLHKYIISMRFGNCWKFLPDYSSERGLWDDDGLSRNLIFGGCGTLMEGEDPEVIESAFSTKWKFIDKYNVLDFDGGVWKFTKMDSDTIFMKNRHGRRGLLINWGESAKEVKNEIPFNENDTITLKDPIITHHNRET